MAKTDKFNSMIEAFECDFVLAKEGKYLISELENKLIFKDEKLMADIDLLEELSYLLRYGKAEIHLIEEPKTKADKIRAMDDAELAEFLENEKIRDEHSLCSDFGNGCYYSCKKNHACHDNIKQLYIEWLQSEAE